MLCFTTLSVLKFRSLFKLFQTLGSEKNNRRKGGRNIYFLNVFFCHYSHRFHCMDWVQKALQLSSSCRRVLMKQAPFWCSVQGKYSHGETEEFSKETSDDWESLNNLSLTRCYWFRIWCDDFTFHFDCRGAAWIWKGCTKVDIKT